MRASVLAGVDAIILKMRQTDAMLVFERWHLGNERQHERDKGLGGASSGLAHCTRSKARSTRNVESWSMVLGTRSWPRRIDTERLVRGRLCRGIVSSGQSDICMVLALALG